jgi:hypothetical protein
LPFVLPCVAAARHISSGRQHLVLALPCTNLRPAHEFARGCIAIATSAPIKIAGKSCPTIASAVVIERANGSIGVISLPIVVSVAKLKYVIFAES